MKAVGFYSQNLKLQWRLKILDSKKIEIFNGF